MKLLKTQAARLLFILPLLSILLSVNPSSAETGKRPKIGLVLAGGGALGFAHVGVLKILEENNIPIDMIAGTSMGAIVGAAYASGVSLEELEKILTTTNWGKLFSETPERRKLGYRSKAGRDHEILGDTKFGFQDGSIVMPTGVLEGQNISLLLQRVYSKVPSPADFDKFPIPYRAVTADIETGKAVVLSKGDLATSVRASMSVPGILSPVEIDGKWLVDGGIANNLPIDVTLGMGADILIVVELNAEMSKKEDLNNPLSIAGQIISLLLTQNATLQKQLLRPQDIMIEPDLTGYSATDFPKGSKILKTGEVAATAFLDKLKKLSIPEKEYMVWQQKRIIPEPSAPEIQFVRVESDSKVARVAIKQSLSVKEGDIFNRDLVEADMERVFNVGHFLRSDYTLVEEDGKTGLVVEAPEKKWMDNYLRVGATLEEDFDGNSTFSLALAHRILFTESYGAYLEAQLEVGKSPRLGFEYYQMLGTMSKWFIAPELELERESLYIQQNGDDIADYARQEGSAVIKLGRKLGRSGEALVGIKRGFGKFSLDIGDPAFPEPSYDTGLAFFRAAIDDLDAPDFPKEGSLAEIEFRSALEELGDSDEFHQLLGGLTVPYQLSDKNILLFRGDFGVSFQDLPTERVFLLGGFMDISGSMTNSLQASDYGVGRLIFYREFSQMGMPLFNMGFYAGGSLEYTRLQGSAQTEGIMEDDNIFGGTLFVGADTPLLPAYFAFGLNDNDEHTFYFALGRIPSHNR